MPTPPSPAPAPSTEPEPEPHLQQKANCTCKTHLNCSRNSFQVSLTLFFCIYCFSTPECLMVFFKGSASAAQDSICTHCAVSQHSSASPFVSGAIFPVRLSKESVLFTPALLGTPDGCYFPSVDVVIPVKYIKFYFSRNSDPWEVKLGLRWKLLCSGNTADAKSSRKPGFTALLYTRQQPPS